jgi:hypothetical protein
VHSIHKAVPVDWKRLQAGHDVTPCNCRICFLGVFVSAVVVRPGSGTCRPMPLPFALGPSHISACLAFRASHGSEAAVFATESSLASSDAALPIPLDEIVVPFALLVFARSAPCRFGLCFGFIILSSAAVFSLLQGLMKDCKRFWVAVIAGDFFSAVYAAKAVASYRTPHKVSSLAATRRFAAFPGARIHRPRAPATRP